MDLQEINTKGKKCLKLHKPEIQIVKDGK
jgi:hypothetical protein